MRENWFSTAVCRNRHFKKMLSFGVLLSLVFSQSHQNLCIQSITSKTPPIFTGHLSFVLASINWVNIFSCFPSKQQRTWSARRLKEARTKKLRRAICQNRWSLGRKVKGKIACKLQGKSKQLFVSYLTIDLQKIENNFCRICNIRGKWITIDKRIIFYNTCQLSCNHSMSARICFLSVSRFALFVTILSYLSIFCPMFWGMRIEYMSYKRKTNVNTKKIHAKQKK